MQFDKCRTINQMNYRIFYKNISTINEILNNLSYQIQIIYNINEYEEEEIYSLFH